MKLRWFGAALALTGCGRGPSGPPNILLISMDTTRADHMSVYGYERQTTPMLEDLAARGTVFERSFSQANESAYSHGALFTGRYASELAAPTYETYEVPESALFVSEVLQLYGYETAAFIAGGHVSDGFGFDQGFDSFSSERGFALFWHTAPKALQWLEQRPDPDRPWFMVLHGYDAHRPYVVPPPFEHMFADGAGSDLAEGLVRDGAASEKVYDRVYYPDARQEWFTHSSGQLILEPESYEDLRRSGSRLHGGYRLTDADVGHIQAHYDAMVAYADWYLGMFLAAAERQGLLDNTVVIVTGDHGEDLLDHDFVNHRTTLYDTCVRVPLIMTGPGVPEGARVDDLVEAIDIVPTILDLAGAEAPAGLTGHSLIGVANGTTPDRDAVFIEGVMDMIAVRTSTHKLVYSHAPLDDSGFADKLEAAPFNPARFELLDLVVDPGETHNLLVDPTPEALALAEQLRARLVAWRRSLAVGSHVQAAEAIGEEQRAMLRDHGYWEMGATEGSDTKASPAEAGGDDED